jgi:hypothetical protein
MTWQIECQPAVSEYLGLKAVGVRNRDYENSSGLEQRDRSVDRLARMAQVLERMPEHDGGPFAVDVRQLGCQHVGPRRFTLESERLTAVCGERVDQCSIAGPDIQHRAGRCDSIEAARQPAAGMSQ